MSKVVVFDFDGTLIKGDSLTKVFINACSGLKTYYKPLYYSLKVLSKLKIISVRKEKEIAVKLLFDNSNDAFIKACQVMAHKLELTSIMDTLNNAINKNDKVVVLSASSEYLLQEFFANKNVEIIATKFSVDNAGKIKGICQHPYGRAKLQALKENGYTHIDECYFDSESDRCLEDICDKCFLVKP